MWILRRIGPGRISGEDVAVCDEALLEKFLEEGTLSAESIAHQIKKRQLYPCYFGSALKDEGVQEFLDDMARYMEQPTYPRNSAPVYTRLVGMNREIA